MIIECKNCLKKFTVRDSDIPIQGRIVQCSNCSSQWQQMPIASSVTTANLDVDKLDQNRSKNEFMASDGKKISQELNKLAGKKQVKKSKTIDQTAQSADQYQETEKGMGIFSFLIVFITFVAAIILALDTFKHLLIPLFPD